jgi:hypothetical protein
MLLHGQLSVGARLAAIAHLAVCPSCRKRKAELDNATKALALEIRGPLMPLWRPHGRLILGKDFVVGTVAVVALLLMTASYYRTLRPMLVPRPAPEVAPLTPEELRLAYTPGRFCGPVDK